MQYSTALNKRMGARMTWRSRAIGPILIAFGLFWQYSAPAQQVAWPIKVLRPPGSDSAAPSLASVAVSGDRAITGYSGSLAEGFRVYSRTSSAGAWSAPQLLAQGSDATDGSVVLSADWQRLAIASPLSAGGGRVAIFKRGAGPGGWILEQTIAAPNGVIQFGGGVSLRGNLLVVTADLANSVYSYRFDTTSGVWVDAGFQYQNIFLGTVSAVTDGSRIAYCRPLMQGGCAVADYSAVNGWQIQSAMDPPVDSTGRVIGMTSTDLFIRIGETLAIYKVSSGPLSPLSDQYPYPGGFRFSSDDFRFVAATATETHFFDPSIFGIWVDSSQAPISADAVAIEGSRVLVGDQSFRQVGSGRIASGIAAGVPDLSDSLFGQTEVVDDELWIGASGFDSSDSNAGAVWTLPIDADGLPDSGPALGPASPALQDYFGAEIAAGGGRVAISSTGARTTNDSVGRVSIFDATTHALQQVIDLPDAGSTIRHIAIAADTLVVSRQLPCSGSCSSDVLVYTDQGAGFVFSQTIPFPVGASAGAQFATTLRLRGDWLLSGKLMFKRSMSADFEFVAELEKPPGMSWGPGALSRESNPLVVATWPSVDRIALVYSFDDTTGWTLSGAVKDGGLTLDSECLDLDVGIPGIGCIAASESGEKLFLAIPDAVGTDWSLVGASPALAPNELPRGHYSMRMNGDRAFVGRIDTVFEPAGRNIGKVTVLSFDESIFGSGFE